MYKTLYIIHVLQKASEKKIIKISNYNIRPKLFLILNHFLLIQIQAPKVNFSTPYNTASALFYVCIKNTSVYILCIAN